MNLTLQLKLELKKSAALALPDGVTIARRSTTSLAKDCGDIGFFLGVSPMISADTSKRLLSMSSIVLLMWWREEKNVNNKMFNFNAVVS